MTTGSLSSGTLARALTFAEVAMWGLLDAGSAPEGAADVLDDAEGSRLEVYQAQGMVMVQLGVSAEEALTRRPFLAARVMAPLVGH